MNIRPAILKDISSINEIYNQAITAGLTGDVVPVSDDTRKTWLEQHMATGYPVFVEEDNERIRGWLSFSAYRPGRQAMRHTAEISYYVDQHHHRLGIGKALVDFAVQTAPQYQFKTLITVILDHNTASIRLMEKCGFQRWGLLPNVAEFDGLRRSHVYYGLNI